MKLPPFRLERFFARHELRVPHHLCASDCETWTVGEILGLGSDRDSKAREALETLRLAYTEPEGHPDLRAAIAGLYERITPDDVLVFCGGEEAIFALMHCAFVPGDRIAVHVPSYQSLHEVARARGCTVTPWRGRAADRWALDPSTIGLGEGAPEAGKPAGVVVNFPHNPTGYLMDRGRFETLVTRADDLGVRLISDEVYRFLEVDDDDRLPAACDLSGTAVSLGVVSKSFGLPGLRIGWVACRDRGLLDRLATFKDYLTICPPAPSELLATLALRHRDTVLARNREILLDNLALLTDFMDRHRERFAWIPPTAGPVAYPALRGDGGTNHFCAEVLDAAGVLLLPGSTFDPDDHRHFRIGFGRRDFRAGLEALEGYLEDSRGR
jgi:aspartate/methionine/tyrosine aminotransferase